MRELHEASGRPIYVSYLPAPGWLRRVIILTTGAAAWIALIAAAAWAWPQRDPGPAVWDDGHTIQLEGTLVCDPYPMLILPASAQSPARVTMLVETGKHGAQLRARAFDHQHVSARGWKLTRDGRDILELDEAPDAIVASNRPAQAPSWNDPAPATLRGEIVDYKCYLGAMKPGDGKAHRACASLCIRGGIPPVLVSRDEGGQSVYTVIVARDRSPIGTALLDLVAQPVEIRGELIETAGLRVLCTDIQSIRTL